MNYADYTEVNKLLYTPLDIPKPPEFCLASLKAWLKDTYLKQKEAETSQLDAGGVNESEAVVKEQYPWDLTLAYLNMFDSGPGWCNSFDKLFPELSNWMLEGFGLDAEDVGSIIMLPVRENHKGQGFWHNDPEPWGIRFYLEFEEIGANKLLMRRTKEPYNFRRDFDLPVDIKELTKEPTMECKILHNKQGFFLNNVRAIHSTYTEIPNKTRIACFITSKARNPTRFLDKISALALRSAKAYPEYAIWWKD